MSAVHSLEITDQNRPNHVLMRPKNVIKVQADSFGAADLCGFANRICEGTEQIPPAFFFHFFAHSLQYTGKM